MKDKFYRGYVKTDRGDYLLQIPDHSSQWGFYLADFDQIWDGGFGFWETVPEDEVPAVDRERLGWILDELDSND